MRSRKIHVCATCTHRRFASSFLFMIIFQPHIVATPSLHFYNISILRATFFIETEPNPCMSLQFTFHFFLLRRKVGTYYYYLFQETFQCAAIKIERFTNETIAICFKNHFSHRKYRMHSQFPYSLRHHLYCRIILSLGCFSFIFQFCLLPATFAVDLSVSLAMCLNKYSFILTSFGWFVGFYGCCYCCLRHGLLARTQSAAEIKKSKYENIYTSCRRWRKWRNTTSKHNSRNGCCLSSVSFIIFYMK